MQVDPFSVGHRQSTDNLEVGPDESMYIGNHLFSTSGMWN